tara:strand:+ start:529 stop:849 length:321 start_codon:yes stop_codon:yes gene_type:complete
MSTKKNKEDIEEYKEDYEYQESIDTGIPLLVVFVIFLLAVLIIGIFAINKLSTKCIYNESSNPTILIIIFIFLLLIPTIFGQLILLVLASMIIAANPGERVLGVQC